MKKAIIYLLGAICCLGVIIAGFVADKHHYVTLLPLRGYGVFTLMMACIGCALMECKTLWLDRLRSLFATPYGLVFGGLWVLVFVMNVACARSFDLLESDFFTAGPRLLIFNVSRVLFIVYLCFALYEVGHRILLLICPNKPFEAFADIGSLGKCVILIMTGSAVVTIALFLVGISGGLNITVVLLLAVPIIFSSAKWVSCFFHYVVEVTHRYAIGRDGLNLFMAMGVISMTATGVVATVISKTIWVGGAGGDVYTHYLPYYRAVINAGSLAPNDVWYHYYLSKGPALNFLAMLLSDELGTQLITTLFHFVSFVLVYLLGKSLFQSRLLALLCANITLYAFVAPDHWSIFLKHHELMLCWIMYGVYLAYLICSGHVPNKQWTAVSGLYGAVFALQFPTAAPFMMMFFGVCCVISLFQKSVNIIVGNAWIVLSMGMSLCLLLLFNQSVTGMALETPTRLFWALTNLSSLSRWISPYLVVYLLEGSSPTNGTLSSPFSGLLNAERFFELFRIRELPVFAGAKVLLLLAGLGVFARILLGHAVLIRSSTFTKHARLLVILLCLFSLVAWLFANLIDQPVSVYRMFSFLVPIAVLGTGVFVSIMLKAVAASSAKILERYMVAALIVACMLFLPVGIGSRATPMFKFAVGASDAYTALKSVPALANSVNTVGETWTPYLQSRRLIGAEEKILCFNTLGGYFGTSYSFPGAGMLNEVSFSLGPQWHDICFGDSETAIQELKRQGINYFIVDWAHQWLFGAIPYSRLFERASLSRYFGVVSQWPGVWLLTWKDSANRELTEAELNVWEVMSSGIAQPQAEKLAEAIHSHVGVALGRGDLKNEQGASRELSDLLSITSLNSLGLSDGIVRKLYPSLSHDVRNYFERRPRTDPTTSAEKVSGLIAKKVSDEAMKLLEDYWTASLAAHGSDEAGNESFKFPIDEIRGASYMNRVMKELAQVNQAIYSYNGGRLTSIERPAHIPRAGGWQ